MKEFDIVNLPQGVSIGRQTETGVRTVHIDCSAWYARWPALHISIMHTRPGESAAYPVATHLEGNCVVWDVNAADTEHSGEGMAEIVGTAEGQKKLSQVVRTYIYGTTTGTTTETPDPVKPWVDTVLDAARRAEEAADRAGGGTGSSSGSGSVVAGKDGGYYLPSVDSNGTLTWRASQSGMPAVASVNIKGLPGADGVDGKDGADGKDYILTDADKREIAGMVEVSGGDAVTDDHINSLIHAALGVIENGTY